MESRPSTTKFALCMGLVFVLEATQASSVQAREAESEQAAPIPCAVIDVYSGETDLLDSSRTHLLKMTKRTAVPCGAWISVKTGHAEIKHRDGHRFHLGRDTFAQVPENNTDGRFSGDHLVLFSGQVYAQAQSGNGELRVITANARARVRQGSSIVVYNQTDDETQVIAVENTSDLENRFETARRVKLVPGEASSLNFKLLRVVPSVPKAVAIAQLRPKFDDLHVQSRTRTLAVRNILKRQDRAFAAPLVDTEGQEGAGHARSPGHPPARGLQRAAEVEKQRAPAAKSAWRDPKTYDRHGEDAVKQESQALHKRWVNRVVADAPDGESLLQPPSRSPASGKNRKAQIIVKDTEGRKGARGHSPDPEEAEKRRLIEELSRIRED